MQMQPQMMMQPGQPQMVDQFGNPIQQQQMMMQPGMAPQPMMMQQPAMVPQQPMMMGQPQMVPQQPGYMPQQNQVQQMAPVNDNKGELPKEIVLKNFIGPDVYWTALGWDIKCQMTTVRGPCGNLAYQYCNHKTPCWNGCGKAVCMEHCEVITRKGHIRYWHCSGGANNDCEASHTKMRRTYNAITCGFMFIIFLIISNNVVNQSGPTTVSYNNYRSGYNNYYSGSTSYKPPKVDLPKGGEWNLQLFNEDQLQRHNEYRQKHNAQPLELDQNLMKESQKWSEYLIKNDKFEHDFDNKYGENLAMKWGSSQDFRIDYDLSSVQRWYDEIKDYDYDSGKSINSNPVGHFTQVVWKGSKKLGCGHASNGNKVVVTCRYDPPGNYLGQYQANVQRP